MAKWFGLPKRGAAHPTFREVTVQHGGKRWTATWHVQNDRLVVDSAWGCASEPITADMNQPTRAAEMLRTMAVARAGASDKPGDG